MNQRKAVALSLAANTTWGLQALYLPLLAPASGLEVTAHRIIWSAVFAILLVMLLGRLREPVASCQEARVAVKSAAAIQHNIAVFAVTAALMGTTWTVYIMAVMQGFVVEAALGLFLSPLISAALGVIVLREKLRPVMRVALGISAVGIAVMVGGYGHVPWFALGIAIPWSCYSLLKKHPQLGADQVDIPAGFATESALLSVPALGYVAWLALSQRAAVGLVEHTPIVLGIGAGLWMGIALLSFNASLRHIPLSRVGILQNINPSIQFLIGIVIFHEAMPIWRWIGFGFVGIAAAIATKPATPMACQRRGGAVT